MILIRQLCQRQAQAGAYQPHFCDRPFYRNGIGFNEQIRMQPRQSAIGSARGGEISRECRNAHFMHQLWRNIGRDRNNAVGTQQ